MDDIVSDERRAANVISSLSRLFKKDTGTPQPMNLKDLVTESLALIRMDLTTRGVSVVQELDGEGLMVLADRVQLQQVLINLCLNAAEAMAGQPPIDRVLTLYARAPDHEFLEVAVRDRGCGLSEEQIKRVFEPFHTSKPTGLGMGLSICRTIVQAHGGRIWIESNTGQGATVRFTLRQAKNA